MNSHILHAAFSRPRTLFVGLLAILIAGATASGKSSLALILAKEFDGVIVNADSCQIYKELSIISARPSADEMEQVPHRLYGHVSGSHAYSTGAWLHDVEKVLDEISGLGKQPIFVGGTGLYYKALLEGLSKVPEIDGEVRQFWREEAERLGDAEERPRWMAALAEAKR